jgi:hypothetical protein
MDANEFEELFERGLTKLQHSLKAKDVRTFTSIQYNQYEGRKSLKIGNMRHGPGVA